MSSHAIFSDFAAFLHSDAFRSGARHPDAPNAFTRQRILPLPILVATMLSGMRKSVQTELNEFFAHLQAQAELVRQVSAQAFAQARANLSLSAVSDLNTWLVDRVEQADRIPRWRGLRLVSADSSTVQFALRASAVKNAASATQRVFGLFLPGAELTLCASLHSIHEGERQILFELLQHLRLDDLLLLDRGFPCRWLVALLNHLGIAFCMRVDASGFAAVRHFANSSAREKVVVLPAPDRTDALAYGAPRRPQKVRLIRQISPSGEVRVLMTNLFDIRRYPADAFGDLYHQRWRIEEAFKRLKHRLQLEHVTGLSQQAVVQDLAAKILADNLHALAVQDASDQASLDPEDRINRAHAISVLKPLWPRILLLAHSTTELLDRALALIATSTYRHRPGLSKTRPDRPKPHRFMTQKPC